jgi:hypothetical protein
VQGRSIGISLSNVDMDLVITSAPSEATMVLMKSDAVTADDELDATYDDWRLNEAWIRLDQRGDGGRLVLKDAAAKPEWQTAPLRIPNREVARWEEQGNKRTLLRCREDGEVVAVLHTVHADTPEGLPSRT